jgi:hypothetical protein
MTDLPANLAQACEAWARLEAHLIEYCGLGQGALLERERPALIRVLVAALDAPPAPAPIQASAQLAALTADAGGAGHPVCPVPNIATPLPDPSPPQISRITRGVWYSAGDLPAPDLAKARADGPGYDCRQCGRRVRGARHSDPRLLCPTCTLSEGHSSAG